MTFIRIIPLIFLFIGAAAPAMTLQQYLDEVNRKHRGLEAQRLQHEAAIDKRIAGDIGLMPVLTLKGSYLSDEKLPNPAQARRSDAREYSITLAKTFSTGTQVAISGKTSGVENHDINAFLVQNNFGQPKFATGSLGISLSQSLWKNFFGHATRLRQKRELYTADAETALADLQSRQILIDAENAFWDYIYAQEDLEIKRAALSRAQKIETWIKRRVGDNISDRADLLNSQALVATRRLQLTKSEDDFAAARRKIRDNLELNDGERLPELTAQIGRARDPRRLIGDTSGGRVMRLDAWIAQLEAKARAAGAEEAKDANRSDLVLEGAYNTNTYWENGEVMDGTKGITSPEMPTKAISLKWTYMFDLSAKTAAAESARKQALAAQYKAERASRESDTSWSEFVRRHAELQQMVEAAKTIQRLQTQRAKANADRLARGRSVTSEVIISEQDAAEADLRATELQVQQRKLESSSRLFIVVKE